MGEPERERRYLVARYDVTGLPESEVEGLSGEVHAMADKSEFHSAVGVEVAMSDEMFSGTAAPEFKGDFIYSDGKHYGALEDIVEAYGAYAAMYPASLLVLAVYTFASVLLRNAKASRPDA